MRDARDMRERRDVRDPLEVPEVSNFGPRTLIHLARLASPARLAWPLVD
jgi:hypothetical protein